MRKNLILIGMPGAGKSTIGVVLAKMLAMDFVDCDLVIQNKEGRRLSEIIADEGPEGFIEIEDEINSRLECEGTVIATGGSAVYGARAMARFAQSGIILYLKLSFNAVDARLCSLKGRGVVMKKGQTLRDIYEERTALYERYADVTVDAEGLSIEETLEKTLQAVQSLLQ